jgi:[ribosomal protein S5]-alanine N-acetyltransferase
VAPRNPEDDPETGEDRRGSCGLAPPELTLEDGPVRLRPWRFPDDLDCVRQAADDPRIPEATTVPASFTPEAGRAYLARQHRRAADGEGLSLAIADARTDEALGSCVLLARPQRRVLGVGYWVVPRARERGLVARAVRLLTDWALREAGVARVEAWVEPGNLPSQRVLAAAGFVRAGVLRSALAYEHRRADVVVFSRIAGD